ncbi:MAG: hypothetical protein ACERKZ_21435 [Lachnotalea sp.]
MITKKISKCVFFTRAYATSCPIVSLLSVKHSNGTSFTDWNKGSVYVDTSLWDGGTYYSNSTSVKYINTTSVTGNLPFLLGCDGGTPSIVAGSVSLSLNTK